LALKTLAFVVFASGCGGGEAADDSPSSGGQGAGSGESASGGQTSEASGGTTSGASGGTTGGTGGSGLSSGSGGGESDGEFFITAIVDGVERRMTTHLYGAVIPDREPEQIALAAKDDPTAIQEIWQLQFEHVAGTQEHAFAHYKEHDFSAVSAWQQHPITLHLNATAPDVGDVFEGTFEGTLITDSTVGATVEVTDGQFRIRRVNPY
jgi:hypothetical protein